MSEATRKLSAAERDRRVLDLYEQVAEVERRLIPVGLHVFGQPPATEDCADLLFMIASFDRPELGTRALTDLVAEGLGLGAYAELVAGRSESSLKQRETVDSLVRAAVSTFIARGEGEACGQLGEAARVEAEESGRVFKLLGRV